MKKVLVLMGLAIASVATPVAQARPDVSKNLVSPGTLTVGTDAPYAPFEFGDPPHYRGFDIDLVNALARKLDLKVKIVDRPYSTLIPRLRLGGFDLIASAMSITPQRRRQVSFMKANFDSTQSIMVRRGSGIRSVRDLAGLTIGAQDGTTGEWFAIDRTPARKVLGYPSGAATVAALKNGQVAAVILDEPIARQVMRGGVRGLKIAKSFSVGNKYAYAVKKPNNRLRKGLNWAFGKVKADGTFRRIYRRWFGMNPPPSLRR